MVVGWYHSHPGFGCWLSGVDINTQQVCCRARGQAPTRAMCQILPVLLQGSTVLAYLMVLLSLQLTPCCMQSAEPGPL